ncbi:hypothetical protein BWI15_25160 [Kribbella sp. ALI-6-A]|nr:hypothetical protein BWI15_25160 [Kribbella sp. ALI-6-A]
MRASMPSSRRRTGDRRSRVRRGQGSTDPGRRGQGSTGRRRKGPDRQWARRDLVDPWGRLAVHRMLRRGLVLLCRTGSFRCSRSRGLRRKAVRMDRGRLDRRDLRRVDRWDLRRVDRRDPGKLDRTDLRSTASRKDSRQVHRDRSTEVPRGPIRAGRDHTRTGRRSLAPRESRRRSLAPRKPRRRSLMFLASRKERPQRGLTGSDPPPPAGARRAADGRSSTSHRPMTAETTTPTASSRARPVATSTAPA